MPHSKGIGHFLRRLVGHRDDPSRSVAAASKPTDPMAHETPRQAPSINPDMYVSMYAVNRIWRGIDIHEFGPPGLIETSAEKAMRAKVMLMVDRAFQAGDIGIKASNDRTTIGYPSSGITMMFSGDPAPSEYDAAYLDNYYLRAGDLMRIATENGLDHPRFERSLHRLGTALINVSNDAHTAHEQDSLRQVHKAPSAARGNETRKTVTPPEAPAVSPLSPLQL